ncbi:MAG: type II toxin-antitoxin system MqsA family antitoxin [Ignavibacteriales bacterium]|nr:type II toxin-antitoxin system MqsA family antitoxin [Ignavibacteriales bacterium]
MKNENQYCFLCGGSMSQQRVTKIQTWEGELVGIIENVPAWVCNQCGERFYDGPVLEKIEALVKENSKPEKNLTVPAYVF